MIEKPALRLGYYLKPRAIFLDKIIVNGTNKSLVFIQYVRLQQKHVAKYLPTDQKLPDVPSLIADRRHSLFGHICRLPQNTPVLQLSIEANTGTPPAADWKRPPGRPRRNWLQQLEEDTGLSVGAAWIAGHDRSMWRTLRPSAGQAQQ